MWIWAAAADDMDPHCRGQEKTKPDLEKELTKVETVKFKAQPKTLPLPGLPYQAQVAWDYTRQTDLKTYTYSVKETRSNAHVLVRQHIWARPATYNAGSVVCIRGALERLNISNPAAFHVITCQAGGQKPVQPLRVRPAEPEDHQGMAFSRRRASTRGGGFQSNVPFPGKQYNLQVEQKQHVPRQVAKRQP